MSYLSSRQQEELDCSVIQYLQSKGIVGDELAQVVSALGPNCQKAQVPANYLEKKWATVLNLQKRVYQLEKQLEAQEDVVHQYDDLLKNGPRSRDKIGWVPSHVRATLRYHNGSVSALAFHPYKPLLATAGQDGSIALWNLLDTSEPEFVVRNAHSRAVNSLCFQPSSAGDNPLLASAGSDLLVKVWDTQSDTFSVPLQTLSGHDHLVSCCIFSSLEPGQLVTASRDHTLRVWDVSRGTCLRTIKAHSDWVRAVDLTHSVQGGHQFALSCSNDQSCRLTYLNSGAGIGLCIGHTQVVEDAVFLPNPKPFLQFDTVTTPDLDTYNKLGYLYCASCGRDNMIKFWRLPLPNMASGVPSRPGPDPRAILVCQVQAHSSWVRHIAVHPSGNFLASCSDDKTIKVWDLRTIGSAPPIEPVAVLKSHENFVNTLAFASPVLSEEYPKIAASSDESDTIKARTMLEQGIRCYLASGSADSTAKVWT